MTAKEVSSTALVPAGQAAQMTLGDMRNYGELFAQSGFFEGRTPAQCAVLVMAGHEIGVPPFAAMNGIYMIKGRPFVGAQILAAKIKASGRYDYRVEVSTEDVCTIAYVRLPNGEIIGKSTYTFAMATKARLTGSDTYQKHTADMLYARAMTRGAKRFCPDVINGLDIAVDEPQPEREPVNVTPAEVAAYVRRDDTPLGQEPMPETIEAAIDALAEVVPGVVVTETQPAPQVQQPPRTGKKAASVQTPAWRDAADALAVEVPYYQDSTGHPSYYHMLGAAVKLGFEAVTPANLSEVIAALRQYAQAQADATA
jgi:hypothetical protein